MRQLDLDKRWQEKQGLAVAGVRPRPGFGEQAGEQARTPEGVPRWIVSAVTSGGEMLAVTIPAATAPELPRFAPVTFPGLIAGGSSSGLWFAADGVEVSGG